MKLAIQTLLLAGLYLNPAPLLGALLLCQTINGRPLPKLTESPEAYFSKLYTSDERTAQGLVLVDSDTGLTTARIDLPAKSSVLFDSDRRVAFTLSRTPSNSCLLTAYQVQGKRLNEFYRLPIPLSLFVPTTAFGSLYPPAAALFGTNFLIGIFQATEANTLGLFAIRFDSGSVSKLQELPSEEAYDFLVPVRTGVSLIDRQGRQGLVEELNGKVAFRKLQQLVFRQSVSADSLFAINYEPTRASYAAVLNSGELMLLEGASEKRIPCLEPKLVWRPIDVVQMPAASSVVLRFQTRPSAPRTIPLSQVVLYDSASGGTKKLAEEPNLTSALFLLDGDTVGFASENTVYSLKLTGKRQKIATLDARRVNLIWTIR